MTKFHCKIILDVDINSVRQVNFMICPFERIWMKEKKTKSLEESVKACLCCRIIIKTDSEKSFPDIESSDLFLQNGKLLFRLF